MSDSIYNLEGRLTYFSKRLANSKKISNTNKKLINDFLGYCAAQGLSKHRILKYLYMLTKLTEMLGKNLKTANKHDIQKLVAEIEGIERYSDWTKKDLKVSIKKFYKWLNGGEEYPDSVKWLKVTMKNNRKMLPESLLTIEQVQALANVTTNMRDKALIMCLYESGARIGELLGMKIKHVEPNDYGVKIMLHGKTGGRRILLINSAPLLSEWLELHPDKNNPEAWVWIGLGQRNMGKRLRYPAVKKVIKTLCQKASIKTRVYPHLFRHSRATELAKSLTEAQMNQVFGWVQGSNMPATYVHLSGRDTDEAVLRAAGVKNIKAAEKGKILRTCPRCRSVNTSESQFCKACGMPMDLETIVTMEKKRRAGDMIVELLLSIPSIRKQAIKQAKKQGLTKEIEELIEA